jgi:hypothetical protein
MVIVVRGVGVQPPTLTSQANFTLMMECTPESGGCNYVYSVLRELGGWPVLEGDAWNQTGKDNIINRWQFKHRYSFEIVI